MKKNPNIAAAVDVGSNAVRMSIALRRKGEGFKEIFSSRAAIRLGHDVFSTGKISPGSLKALARAFKGFKAQIRQAGAGHARVVATAALREARNQARVLRCLAPISPARVEVISGTEEARLIQLAVERKMGLKGMAGNVLLVELGGGSAEVTLVSHGELKFSESMKVGAVRLLEVLSQGATGRRRFDSLVARYCDRILYRFKKHLPQGGVDVLVGTGGNVEALANLAGSGRRRAEGPREIKPGALKKIFKEIRNLSLEGRAAKLGLRPDRADVIEPAAVVYLELMRVLGVRRMLVPFANLRQGVLADLFSRHLPGEPAEDVKKQVMDSVRFQGRRFHLEEKHASRVTALTLSLFDQLGRVHRLDGEARLLLETAAWLHDAGLFIGDSGHHKHSYYLISAAMDFPLLTRRQIELAALAARYHRRSAPKKEHRPFSQLRRKERLMVLKMAALLRLGDALDRSHQGRVREVKAVLRGKNLTLAAQGRKDLALEKWGVREKGALFEKVFGIKVALAGPA